MIFIVKILDTILFYGLTTYRCLKKYAIISMEYSEIKYWVALKRLKGIGNLSFKNLLDAYGAPRKAFEVDPLSLIAVSGIDIQIAKDIHNFNQWDKIDEELDTAQKLGVSIITCHDPLYPQNLQKIYDPPPYLYVKGNLKKDDINLAVVGSRAASTYGRYSTERICRELTLRGITIVSGLARGIDSSAHRGALSGKGRTIAVLGTGLDIIYPPENKKLFEAIIENGAALSEFPFHTPPNAFNFPTRNRIISGLSYGVVVIEATDRSGSLITARLALEQGREVFAVPGNIDSLRSRGAHKLIKQGAKLIENVDDILEDIFPQVNFPSKTTTSTVGENKILTTSGHKKTHVPISAAEQGILKLLSTVKPMSVDDIICSSGNNPQETLNILLTLELKGFIRQLPGKKFVIEE
jgi:DNA processing protein